MTVTRQNCRQLRRNATGAEKRLWSILRNSQFGGFKFRRQHPCGPYILDFFCLSKKLAVEVDGDSHFVDEGLRRDAVRTAYLRGAGIDVIRFTNSDVFQRSQIVKQVLWKALTAPHPNPLPKGEGNGFSTFARDRARYTKAVTLNSYNF
jgi:very-short-patch-repair endonuclease